jgi:hypothetical protein
MTTSGRMTGKRFAGVCAAAFLVSQILEIAVHGFILRLDYAPYYGTLLRPMTGSPGWQGLLLPVAHLSYIIALVWVYDRIPDDGSRVERGLRIGVIGFAIGQVPLWLLWYAEQPWPGALVLKQLVLEAIAALVVGLTIAGIAAPATSRASTRPRAAEA